MPHTNGHTVIEMSPRHRRRSQRGTSPRGGNHESPTVHSSRLDRSPASRGPSPAPDRQPHHTNNHNGNHNNHHNNGNHHRSNTNLHHETETDKPDKESHSRNRRDVAANENGTEHLQPLLETDTLKPKPPLAGPEIDDLDDRTEPASPDNHPGVDDGFFPNNEKHPDDRVGSEDEEGHHKPGIEINPPKDDDDTKSVSDESDKDETDALYPGYGNFLAVTQPMLRVSSHSSLSGINGIGSRFNPDAPFPYAPEFGPGVEVRITPDVNVYQQKKNLAQGMMDLALLSANANQLRYVLEAGYLHPYYYPSLIFISASLILQIAVGVGLIINSRYNVKEHDDICKADRINDFTVIGIFLITIVNVFIASFGVATSPNTSVSVAPAGPS